MCSKYEFSLKRERVGWKGATAFRATCIEQRSISGKWFLGKKNVGVS